MNIAGQKILKNSKNANIFGLRTKNQENGVTCFSEIIFGVSKTSIQR